MKVLIVEDNVNFSRVLKDTLQTLFPAMVIHEAHEGKQALQQVGALLPELIFMDIKLPGENGLQLTQRIKASHPDMKVVILTNYDILEYREAAIRSGANSFLTKDSLNWEHLENLVKSLFEPMPDA